MAVAAVRLGREAQAVWVSGFCGPWGSDHERCPKVMVNGKNVTPRRVTCACAQCQHSEESVAAA